ncbi:DUF6270 domain-containing protein [Caldibacillus lycopersici]|uniref:DUF6270 domain-containing protein n=1 Tax=Perspicuibacillus lycopersici TaxID=1325689 RepID=A0AAE3ITP8_9BACI|nr:DUF6270 domain-containing protein [Perspicuibacillus lycopersici]MCU9613264.1 DUF6270 domain-containing protein [Perspicuibacillus lycopersici]
MSDIKLAVIGSCVSRDSFNSKFIKDYKQFYQCVLTQNHVSMISLMADPIPFLPKSMSGDLTDFNKQILLTDLTKSVWDSMRVMNPDYLILDFYADVYFGVIKVGDSFLTDKTWLYKRTPFFNQFEWTETIKIETKYDEYMKLWKKAIDAFMVRMKKEFPQIKIIVNKVHFTDFYKPADGGELKRISESGKYKNVDVDQINSWLDGFYQYFEENYASDVFFIHYDKEYVSDENHTWEYFYVHYTPDFYQDFTTKLVSIIMKDLYKTKKMLTADIVQEPVANYNLLRNSSFNEGKAYWTFWQDDFEILKPENDLPNAAIVSINKSGLKEKAYRQLWSNPVEINTNGSQEFTLSFDIKVEDVEKVDADRFIFSLRTYNKIDHVLQKECVWHENIKLDAIKKIQNGAWVRYTHVFKPKTGKFLKVGPYLMQNGHVSWRNIQLVKGKEQDEKQRVSKKANDLGGFMKKLLKSK